MRHILVPVDFSDLSAAALRFAAGIRKCASASLSVVYADQFLPPPYFTTEYMPDVLSHFEHARELAASQLREFVESTIPDEAKDTESRVREGLPADAIRAAARDAGADLIVMGTHGRSGINRLMLGSVTERLVREAEIPVLAVRGDQPAARDLRFRHILAPVNDSPAAKSALAWALEMAACFGARLTVLHVQEPSAKGRIENLSEWTSGCARSGCAIEELIRKGDASEEVIRVARERETDLIVAGSSHRRFLESRVLGTNTIRILRHAPCPVLAVPQTASKSANS